MKSVIWLDIATFFFVLFCFFNQFYIFFKKIKRCPAGYVCVVRERQRKKSRRERLWVQTSLTSCRNLVSQWVPVTPIIKWRNKQNLCLVIVLKIKRDCLCNYSAWLYLQFFPHTRHILVLLYPILFS